MYMRAKQRQAMSSSIREQVQEYGVEMQNSLTQAFSTRPAKHIPLYVDRFPLFLAIPMRSADYQGEFF